MIRILALGKFFREKILLWHPLSPKQLYTVQILAFHKRWETCGPEVARIVSEFEDSLYNQDASSSAAKHHEYNEKFRQKFSRDDESVYQAIPCNPFEMASFEHNKQLRSFSTISSIFHNLIN